MITLIVRKDGKKIASVQENVKDGKVVSCKFIVFLGEK